MCIDTAEMAAETFDNKRVAFYECDYLERMKLSEVLKLASELAGYDYTAKGFSHEFLWERDMVFLVSRVSFKLHAYPTSYDELVSSTWEKGRKGALFMRGFEVKKADGTLLIEGESAWVLVSPTTRRIHRPSAFKYKMPMITDRSYGGIPSGKIEYGNAVPVGTHTVTISELDANGHLYNGNYADIAADIFSQQLFEMSVENFRINFISEAKLGDTIELCFCDEGERAVVIGSVDGKCCFEAEFVFKSQE